MKTLLLCVLAFLLIDRLPGSATAAEANNPLTARPSQTIPAQVTGVFACNQGARLPCPGQKITGYATADGLWIASTASESRTGLFRLAATSLGRAGSPENELPFCATGRVAVSESKACWLRPFVTEEYSAGADGLRQDFVITHRPAGEGRLSLELSLSGAKAVPATYGASLVPAGSNRKLAYNRLRATDANGKELAAAIKVISTDRLAIQIDDAGATYPVRIDPTFSDADWVSLGTLDGANGTVFAITENPGSGALYVGGSFTAFGSVLASNIVEWNGSNWVPLGTGLNGTVRALAVDNSGNLYAAGIFTNSSLQVINVAEWNGTAWSSLGGSLKGLALAIAVDPSGNIYAGGNFTNSSISATNIAEWNGTSWSAMGRGMNSYVSALTADSSGNIYAGGNFTVVNGSSMPYIAEWTGGTWAPLGSGMNGPVNALAIDDGILLAGGGFLTAGGYPVNHIAEWYGGWYPLPSSPATGISGPVTAVAVTSDGIYAGGNFTAAGGIVATNVAFWNGNTWSALPGLAHIISAIAVDSSGNLWAGGAGLPDNLAEWNGNTWSAINTNGINYPVLSVTLDNAGNLYAGGLFPQAGNVTVNQVAEWNGTSWLPLGSGLYAPSGITPLVNSVATDHAGNLYAGGQFTSVGGIVATNIAEWNGTHWLALGTGMNPFGCSVNIVVPDNKGNLYAGGTFTSIGGVAANYIAKWNGTNWSSLGGGLNSSVMAIALDKSGNVYAGGIFTQAGSVAANAVAEWNGANWVALGSGLSVDGGVNGLLPDNAGNLYVGGVFTSAGGVAATNVAEWNGSNWLPLGPGLVGSGFNNEVYCLALDAQHHLYAGGGFSNSGSVLINNLALWNGTNWLALGSGLNYIVTALVPDAAGRLYVGGAFTIAGTNVSAYVAQANVLNLLSGPQHEANGNYSFNFLTTPHSSNRIFATTNLVSGIWQPIGTNVAPANGFLQFTDTAAARYPARLYRFSSP